MYAVERQTSKVHSSDASSSSRRAANFLANLSERSNHLGPNLSVPPSCVSSLADGGSFHPRPAQPAPSGSRLRQVHGDCWEWTSSAYHPYPGFHPPEGAIGEYNGKFMSNQMVLRGGCALTPAGHARTSYRNFFPHGARWAPL